MAGYNLRYSPALLLRSLRVSSSRFRWLCPLLSPFSASGAHARGCGCAHFILKRESDVISQPLSRVFYAGSSRPRPPSRLTTRPTRNPLREESGSGARTRRPSSRLSSVTWCGRYVSLSALLCHVRVPAEEDTSASVVVLFTTAFCVSLFRGMRLECARLCPYSSRAQT